MIKGTHTGTMRAIKFSNDILNNIYWDKIILPGTHDSGAYQIMTTKTFLSDEL